jgi:ABC-type maltose transport system permease subunit
MLLNSAMRMFSANGRTSACVNLVLSAAANWSSFAISGYVQGLPIDLDEQDALDGNRGIRVDDIVV